jgi:predicted O-linked N-acetylglucosamine transferase (SPINDLY family)
MALALRPDYAEAHNNLGTALRASGNLEEAVTAYRRAVELKPTYFEAHNNLGNALRDLGKLEEAIVACRMALTLQPKYAEAHANLGNALSDQGKLEEAVAAYQKALELKPNLAEAQSNLGNALRDLGRLEEAVAACHKAVELRPSYAEAHYNLGNALRIQGKLEEVVVAYQRALDLKPHLAPAHNNLGNVLNEQGKLEKAMEAFQKALALKPDYAEAHNNLGIVLRRLGQLDEAKAAHFRALELKPDFAEAHYNLGNALGNQVKLYDAVVAYQRAIELKPDFAEAHNNLANALSAQGKLEEAVAAYRKALELEPNFAEAHSNLLLAMNYDARFSQESIFVESRRWDETHATPFSSSDKIYANTRDPHRPLRVGYISPDFRKHSVSYFADPLIAEHDRRSFEVFCYAEVEKPDDKTARIRALADVWRSTVGASDSAVAEWIRKDRIDILVDLAGHTAKNRLPVLASKPAPVQVTWLGYPNTTGLSAMDYRLTDEIADPEDATDTLSSEKLVRLPNGFLCYSLLNEAPNISEPPALRDGHVTFGSFNNITKVTPDVVETWARVLDRVPRSRLLIKNRSLADEETRNRYLEMFLLHGIEKERVELRSWIESSSGHLGLYNRVDVALDPFPYNGTTTTCEALLMGVPVVTLCGDRHSGRVGASILSRVALTDLIAETSEAYVETAVELANSADRLSELRTGLRDRVQRSPLCDSRGFARKVEVEYRRLWRHWCSE